MALTVVFALLLVILGLAYLWIRRRFTFLEENGFLHEKPTFPFGNLKGVGKEIHLSQIIHKLYIQFKGKAPAFGIYFFAAPNVVITDLDLVKNVLIRDFHNFHNRGIYFNPKDEPIGANIFSIEDAEWKNMRTKLTPTFTSGKMKVMFGTVLEVAEIMKAQLDEDAKSGIVEMKEALAKFTTDVIGKVAFGLEMNSIHEPDSMFRKMGRKIFKQDGNLQIKAFFLTGFRSVGRKLRMRFFPKDVSDFFMSTIKETVDYRQENKIHRNDVMDMFIRLIEKEGDEGKITFNELAANCFVFFVAGFETSSATSTFILYNLATHIEIQEKLRNEMNKVLAKHDGKLTYEAMQEMTYLQMVIDETLRLYGPIFQLIRVASNDYKIPDTKLTIRKGTLVLIPSHSIHRDPENYPEPDKFDPERFSEENKKERHPMAFIPFGEGPRNCIGMRFGLMQTKIAMVKLLTNYKFLPSSRTTIPMKYDIQTLVLAPEKGMWLKVEKL